MCDVEREALGATVWDAATAAPDMCRECSQKLLAATDDAIARTSMVLEERGRVSAEQYEQRENTDALAGTAAAAWAQRLGALRTRLWRTR